MIYLLLAIWYLIGCGLSFYMINRMMKHYGKKFSEDWFFYTFVTLFSWIGFLSTLLTKLYTL